MTDHEYLKNVLQEEQIDHTLEETKKTRTEIKDFLISHYQNDKNPSHVYSGSIAKNTAIKSKYDIDIGLQFDNEDFTTLEEMFDDVKSTLVKKYGKANTRDQNVSIRVQINGHDIDIVPGRRINNAKNDVYLHIERDSDTRIKSNLHIHVDLIKGFSELETIKLLKTWRTRKAFKFKSFALELMVIKALDNETLFGLDNKFKFMLNYIVDEIDTICLIDPANSNNSISDSITNSQKDSIKKHARRALKCIENGKWEKVFDLSDGKCITTEDAKRLSSLFATTSNVTRGAKIGSIKDC